MKNILRIVAVFVAAVLVTANFSSCSKDDDDNDNKSTNYGTYTYDGKTYTVAWAGFYEDLSRNGLCLGLSSTVPSGQLFDENDFFEIDFPSDRLGENLDMSQYCYGEDWELYGFLKVAGTEIYFNPDAPKDTTTGTIKVTRDGNTFTMQFNLTFENGKTLTGNCSGTFIQKPNYDDVGEN